MAVDFIAQFQSKHAVWWINRMLQGVTIIFVLLTGYIAANFLLFILGAAEPATTARTAGGSLLKPIVSVNPAMIPRWNLFGDSNEARPVQKNNQMEVPKTRLKLELVGVIAGKTEDDPSGSAIIAEKGKGGDVFRLGDRVPGNVTLKAIYKDRVILERKGRLETLAFDLDYKPVSKTSNTAKKAKASELRKAAAKIARPRGSMTPNIREILTRDVPEMVSGLGLEAVNGGGQGYKVTGGAPSALLSRVGLRKDDIILSVNGNPVGNAADDQALLEEVRSSGQAKFEVQRGNQTFTVNYPIR